jgi:hypothetical protein
MRPTLRRWALDGFLFTEIIVTPKKINAAGWSPVCDDAAIRYG